MKRKWLFAIVGLAAVLLVAPCIWYVRAVSQVTTAARLVADLKSPTVAVREKAHRRLVAVRTPPAIRLLVNIVEDSQRSDPEQLQQAIEILAEIGGPAVEPLVAVLASRDESGIMSLPAFSQVPVISQLAHEPPDKETAATVLLAMGPSAVDGLIKCLSHKNPTTRAYAAKILGMMNDKSRFAMRVERVLDPVNEQKVLDALLGTLSDGSPVVRWAALWALRSWTDQRVFDAAAKCLKDGDSRVRQSAVVVLERNVNPSGLEALLSACDDSDATVRALAVKALGPFDDQRAIDKAAAALNDRSTEVRDAAAVVLGSRKDPRAVDALGAMLEHSQGDDRARAARMLSEIRGAGTVEPLIEALAAAGEDNAKDVVKALAKSDSKRAHDAVFAALEDPRPAVRAAAADAYDGLLNDETAVDRLAQLLRNDPVAEVRKRAIYALSNYNAPQATGALLAACGDADDQTRSLAVKFVSWRQAPGIYEAVLKACSDKSPLVRKEAVENSFRFKGDRAVEAALKALSDSSSEVRAAASCAFRSSRDERGTDRLIALLTDSSTDVQQNAALALAAMRTPRTVSALAGAFEGQIEQVKACIVFALGRIGTPEAMSELSRLTGGLDLDAAHKDSDRYITESNKANFIPLMAVLAVSDDMNLAENMYWCGNDRVSWFAATWAEITGNLEKLRASQDSQSRPKWHFGSSNPSYGLLATYQGRVTSLKNPKPAQRARAATSLGSMFREYAIRRGGSVFEEGKVVVVEKVENPLYGVQQQDVNAIVESGEVFKSMKADLRREISFDDIRGFIAALREAAHDKVSLVRAAAVRALGNTGDPVVYDALKAALADVADEVRVAAAYAVGYIEGDAGVEIAKSALQDPSGRVRAAAAWSLGRAGGKSAAEPLITLLADSDQEVRAAAAQSLARLRDARAVAALTPLLDGRNIDVVVSAALALKAIGTGDALRAIEAHSGNKKPEEIAAKRAAYITAGDEKMVLPLIVALAAAGDDDMALELYWSGNQQLMKGALAWQEATQEISGPFFTNEPLYLEGTDDSPSYPKWPGGTPPRPSKETENQPAKTGG